MRNFKMTRIALAFAALLSMAAVSVAHACPNSEAEASQDGGDGQ